MFSGLSSEILFTPSKRIAIMISLSITVDQNDVECSVDTQNLCQILALTSDGADNPFLTVGCLSP
jgi:hypothetical protein